MTFDYSKLKGRIIEKYGSQSNFAKSLGTTEKSISDKLRGKKQWRQEEIYNIIRILEISSDSIEEFFFQTKG